MDKLPKGWKFHKLINICEIIGGGTPKTNILQYWNGSIYWLSPSDLPQIGEISNIHSTTKKISEIGLKNSSARLLPIGSVVYSSRASIGKIGITEVELATNQGFTNFICKKVVLNIFLCYALKYYTPIISSLSNSTTFPEVSKTSLKEFQIPLPPFSEQTRIISKLDALFARIDKSITLLEENIKITKGLMASVLEELFEKLKSKSTIYKIKEIAEIKGGKRLPKGESIQDEKTNFPYIRVTDFTNDGTIDVNSVKYMTQSVHEQIKRYIITSKDLYISIAGTIGKTGIIPKELENANLTENAARLVFKSNLKINNRFVYYFTLSDNFKDQVGLATKIVAQPKLALTRLAEVELPIPSIEIQNKEVKIFDELSRKFQEINTEQLSKLAYLKALKSSILDRAFKGEL